MNWKVKRCARERKRLSYIAMGGVRVWEGRLWDITLMWFIMEPAKFWKEREKPVAVAK
jgi:hypothetical protein